MDGRRAMVCALLGGALLVLLIGCGGTAPTTTSGATATGTTGSAAARTLTLGAQTYNDHGTAGVQGKAEVALEVDNFYFSPSFLQGTPGEQVTLAIANASGTMHNITIDATPKVDMDIPAHGKVTVTAVFPQSGVLRFYCEYHAGMGMEGELLAGSATPQPVAAAAQPTARGYTYP
jgi:plastocyanin